MHLDVWVERHNTTEFLLRGAARNENSGLQEPMIGTHDQLLANPGGVGIQT